MSVLALDFDGVICDSVKETGITGWKAAGTIWRNMGAPLPPASILDAYCLARPIIETGYEAILMMRLLQDGEKPQDLLDAFPELVGDALLRSGMDVAGLKRLYGRVRDRWIEDNPEEWLSLSPFYPGVSDALNNLPSAMDCYIVTTKQERFVARLLEHNNVDFAPERIFGLDRGMRKEAVLRELMHRYPDRPLDFVEDRLPTLKRLGQQSDLTSVRRHIACWGYNTEAERREAARLNIHQLTALKVVEIANAEYDIEQ